MADMTAMIGPDGTSAMVPPEQVQNAIKGGAKMGVHMRGPDGTEAVVPQENAHVAIQKGASAVNPADMARLSIPPPSNPIDQAAHDMTVAPMAGVPGGSINPRSASDNEFNVAAGLIGTAGVATAAPILMRLAAAHPIIASAAIGEARKIPYLGKMIPPYAEMLPFLRGGGGAKPPVEAEGAPAGPEVSMPEKPPLEVLQGRGLAQGGKPISAPSDALDKIPVTSATPEATPEATPVATPQPPNKGALQDLLSKGMGGTELKPNVKLSQQLPALANKAEDLPEGHTPTDSTTVLSYKHDPVSQNFEYSLKNGSAYRHGPVEPEDVQAFEAAKSKGKAVQAIKDKYGSPIAKKYKGGNWINVRRPTATPEDQ